MVKDKGKIGESQQKKVNICSVHAVNANMYFTYKNCVKVMLAAVHLLYFVSHSV
jgi:hypothetical protein